MHLATPSSHPRTLVRLLAVVVSTFLIVLVAPPACVGEELAPIADGRDRTGATAWLARFEKTYESGDADAYARLLTADYRFVFGDAELAARHPEGFTREDELASYRRLFQGGVSAEGRDLPRALRVEVTLRDVTVGADPEHPGDPAYAVVHVGAATLAIAFADGSAMTDTAPHAFWLECTAGTGDWVCRRWVERPAPVLLAVGRVAPGGNKGDPGAAAAVAGGVPGRALLPRGLPFPNPVARGGTVSYAYEVAGTGGEVALELFDAAGRAVAALTRETRPGGVHVARWDGRTRTGVRAVPGLYFLRARIGAVERTARILVHH
jgi:hypothetical protein